MIEIRRLQELKAFFRSHRNSPPEVLEEGYRINRERSKNVLEEHKERAILAAISKRKEVSQ